MLKVVALFIFFSLLIIQILQAKLNPRALCGRIFTSDRRAQIDGRPELKYEKNSKEIGRRKWQTKMTGKSGLH